MKKLTYYGLYTGWVFELTFKHNHNDTSAKSSSQQITLIILLIDHSESRLWEFESCFQWVVLDLPPDVSV